MDLGVRITDLSKPTPIRRECVGTASFVEVAPPKQGPHDRGGCQYGGGHRPDNGRCFHNADAERKVEGRRAFAPSRSNARLGIKFVIFCMRSNPYPKKAAFNFSCNGAVVDTYSRRPHLAHFLEMQ